MKKFKVTVTREDEYEIEFDEEVYNDEFIKDFKEVFYNFDSLKEHAKHIAQHMARFQQRFIEGYGIPLINGEKPLILDERDEENVAHGLNINIISEDDFNCMDIDVEEVSEWKLKLTSEQLQKKLERF